MGREKRARTGWRQSFKRELHDRFLLRFHMFLITAAVLLSGVIVSRVLWSFGLRKIDVRYPIAVACSYLLFFVLIRIWLLYVAASDEDETLVDEEDAADGVEVLVDMAIPSGGGFGGGGGNGSSGGGGSSIGKLFEGDDGGIVLIALGVLLVAVFGSSLYLIWEAPTVLGEAALQMVLATSLTGAARRINEPGWAGSVLGATWIPFVIVLVLTAVFASVASYYCPGASRMSEILNACGSR